MGLPIIIIFGIISSIILLKIFDYTNDKTNYCKNIFDKHKLYQENLEEKINQINKDNKDKINQINKDNNDKINDLKKRLEYKIDMDKNFCGNFKYDDVKLNTLEGQKIKN